MKEMENAYTCTYLSANVEIASDPCVCVIYREHRV